MILILDKLQPREKKMLLVFLAIAIVGGLYYLYTSQITLLENKLQELDSKELTLKTMSIKIAKNDQLRKEYQNLLNQLNSRQNNFLEQGKEPDFLINLNQLSLDTGVKVLSINPGKIVQEDIYIKIPVNISLQGSYKTIIDYLEKIKNLSYLTRLENLRMISANTGDYLEARMTLVSYSLDSKGVE